MSNVRGGMCFQDIGCCQVKGKVTQEREMMTKWSCSRTQTRSHLRYVFIEYHQVHLLRYCSPHLHLSLIHHNKCKKSYIFAFWIQANKANSISFFTLVVYLYRGGGTNFMATPCLPSVPPLPFLFPYLCQTPFCCLLLLSQRAPILYPLVLPHLVFSYVPPALVYRNTVPELHDMIAHSAPRKG